MTTPAEAAEDLYEQLKPEARGIAVEWLLARTPADLQEEMRVVIGNELEGIEPGQGEPPTVVDAPLIYQTGTTLTCTMGNWNGDPDSRTYEWQLDGITVGTAATYSVIPADVGKSAVCVMTASNLAGTSAPATSNTIVVA